MKSRRVLHLFFISRSYGFILVWFFPAVPTLAIFDFMAVIKAESADHPGWVGGEMYRPGWQCRWSRHRGIAAIGGFGVGRGVIGSACDSCGMVASEMFSCREVSQLDDDAFPPSNCCITLLAITVYLLLERTASVTVFTCFRGGSGGVGVELAGRRHSQLERQRC